MFRNATHGSSEFLIPRRVETPLKKSDVHLSSSAPNTLSSLTQQIRLEKASEDRESAEEESLQSLIKKSVLISGVSEKQRNQFFRKALQLIEKLREKIKA